MPEAWHPGWGHLPHPPFSIGSLWGWVRSDLPRCLLSALIVDVYSYIFITIILIRYLNYLKLIEQLARVFPRKSKNLYDGLGQKWLIIDNILIVKNQVIMEAMDKLYFIIFGFYIANINFLIFKDIN